MKVTQWSHGEKWCVPMELPSCPSCRYTWTHQTRAATTTLLFLRRPRFAAGNTGRTINRDPRMTHTQHKGSLTSKAMADLGSSICQAYFIMSWDVEISQVLCFWAQEAKEVFFFGASLLHLTLLYQDILSLLVLRATKCEGSAKGWTPLSATACVKWTASSPAF